MLPDPHDPFWDGPTITDTVPRIRQRMQIGTGVSWGAGLILLGILLYLLLG